MDCMLGIDLGTSATKLGLVSVEGRVIETHSVPNTLVQPRAGWAEMSPEAWWNGILEGVRALCEKASVPPRHIKSVSFSVLYPALICLDKAGNCLRPAILYSDRRSVKQSEWLAANIDGDYLIRTTGNGTPTGTCSLTSMLWVKENEPEVFGRTRWLVHAEGYLAYRFTGEIGMDWTTASLSGLFETSGGMRWSEELCSTAGIPMEKLPCLHPSPSLIGKVTREAAAQTGIAEGTPVAIGAGDTTCSTLGAGLLESGETLLTCGTTDNLSTVVDKPTFDHRNANCAHVVPDRWVLVATMTNTGQALDWFRENFFQEDERSYDYVFEEAATAAPCAGGVLFLPYLHGERSPIWDPRAKAVFHGLNLSTQRAHMLRAVLEGVAFALRQNIEVMEELLGGAIERILTVGGASQSTMWNQIKATVTGKPFFPMKFQQTSLLGAALLGGVAAGIYGDLKEAVAKTRTFDMGEIVQPEFPVKGSYDTLYDLYRRLYPALRDSFRAIDGSEG